MAKLRCSDRLQGPLSTLRSLGPEAYFGGQEARDGVKMASRAAMVFLIMGSDRLQAAFDTPSVTCCWLSVRREMGDLGSMLLGCGGGEEALGLGWHKTTAIGAGSEIPGHRNRNEYGDDTQSGKSRVAIRARSELDPLRGSPADSIAFRATPKIPQESSSSSLFSVLSTRGLETCTSSACIRK